MTDIEQKRAFVAELYSGPGWKRRVANMSDGQVVAIYLREQEHPHTDHHDHSQEHRQESMDDDPPPF